MPVTRGQAVNIVAVKPFALETLVEEPCIGLKWGVLAAFTISSSRTASPKPGASSLLLRHPRGQQRAPCPDRSVDT